MIFHPIKTIVDVGGGNGAFLMAVVAAAPGLRGIVFDEEYVVEETKKEIAVKNLSERCRHQSRKFL